MVHVGGLKVEEVEEGRVVDGERGPRRGDARGFMCVCVCLSAQARARS